jgi:hypothetical protein
MADNVFKPLTPVYINKAHRIKPYFAAEINCLIVEVWLAVFVIVRQDTI